MHPGNELLELLMPDRGSLLPIVSLDVCAGAAASVPAISICFKELAIF